MIKPLPHRLLVKLLPRYSDVENKLNLTIVDGKKHFDGVRRGKVESVARGVKEINAGDTVLFHGDRGSSFGVDEGGVNDGTEWRSLAEWDVMAVEEAG